MKFYTEKTIDDFFKDCAREPSNTIENSVSEILRTVAREGDKALSDYALKFDDISLTPENFKITLSDIDEHSLPLKADEIEAIEFAYTRIKDYALKTKPQNSEMPQGASYVSQKYVPMQRVACYVPSGSSPLISTVLHSCVFAQIAGVPEILMLTSPKKSGVHPAMLYAAKLCGVKEIYTLGGAYGIAAMAYGTQTIKAVDFICGPGNMYVTEAKRQVFGKVAIDMVAGPSEILVMADKTARLDFIAADLLSQAEHGSGFEQAVLITSCSSHIAGIEEELKKQRAKLPENKGLDRVLINGIFILHIEDLSKQIEVANRYAPEHLEIMMENADEISTRIYNAGAIMIGDYTPEPIGDFVAGSSHILPTGGGARFFSGLTTAHFLKKISLQKMDRATLSVCRKAGEVFAQMEELPAHGRSISIRFDGN